MQPSGTLMVMRGFASVTVVMEPTANCSTADIAPGILERSACSAMPV
jgi:hypothetical protein